MTSSQILFLAATVLSVPVLNLGIFWLWGDRLAFVWTIAYVGVEIFAFLMGPIWAAEMHWIVNALVTLLTFVGIAAIAVLYEWFVEESRAGWKPGQYDRAEDVAAGGVQ